MSMPTPDNPHTERLPTGAELEYWCENGAKASGKIGADCVTVYQRTDRGRIRIGDFPLPAANAGLTHLLETLERAFECGRKDKAKEVRKVLGL